MSIVLAQNEYQELRRQCQDFATALLDHTRTSNELEVMLNHDPTGPIFEHGERMHLNRLKLAIKLRQKKVHTRIVSHHVAAWLDHGLSMKLTVVSFLRTVCSASKCATAAGEHLV